MRVLLWLFGVPLCLLPFLYTLYAYPFSLYKRYGGIVETKFSFTEEHAIGFLLTSLLLSLYLYVTRFMFAPFKILLATLTPFIPLALPFFLLLSLTGIFYVLYESRYEQVFVVGLCYGLGVFGLDTLRKSIKENDKEKRWLMLLMGFMSVLIAYFTLEALL